ncbi:unnamed protein product [Alternaria alternata]
METLDNTEWDVLIVGTGLHQSLLALALSRSDKKILHVDENDFYGGAEAAFSLQEAEEWAQRMKDDTVDTVFSDVTITKPEVADAAPALSFSRAYSLSLSPQVIYARSSILGCLVSSRVYRQLEFLAVGTWLLKVPNGREDVFQDHDLDFKAKRALMKFLRFISEYEEQIEVWEEHRQRPFSDFLTEQFKVPASLQGPLLALTLSPSGPDRTTTEYALPRIARAPTFDRQVSCRAGAVGGGVYVLGKGIAPITEGIAETTENGTKLRLKDGEVVTAKWIVGGNSSTASQDTYCRSMTIVSSSLSHLFPPIAEEAPAPAAAVVVFPSGSLTLDSQAEELPPVHVFVHSSDTGECPSGQCVLYASTSMHNQDGFALLRKAIESLLSAQDITPSPTILWSVEYQQRASSGSEALPSDNDHVVRFPPTSMDLAFDDAVLENVKEVWQKIVGDEAGEFLVFQDREAYDDDE